MYLSYADNILLTNNPNEINTIQKTFQNNSLLNFRQEININNKIIFLSVLIDTYPYLFFFPSSHFPLISSFILHSPLFIDTMFFLTSKKDLRFMT